ncbi:MAG: hypothetical protein QUS14_09040 [Pyrinomonadaceae bacterium]|nr:hypothetical protein [Pyrinomonadaceae bacterium]
MAWLEGTVAAWRKVRPSDLRLSDAKLPWMVLFDGNCVAEVNAESTTSKLGGELITFKGEKASVRFSQHDGTITLPDGGKMPAGVISFAANYAGGAKTFFTAALPAVWRADKDLSTEPRIDTLVRAVYVHELTHTYHRNFFARLTEIERSLNRVENFGDDIIQKRFGTDERFAALYRDEIGLAERAVNTAGRTDRKRLARQLLAAIKSRRDAFYTGDNAQWAEIEDIFLTMEGVANWAGYRAAVRDGLSQADASKLIRRSGAYWSQEEGILIFMLIDSLLPGWQRRVFNGERVSIIHLLEAAAR